MKAENLKYWDRYRELKLELVKEYVAIMKLKKRMRDYAALIGTLSVMKKLDWSLKDKQRQRRMGLHSLIAAIKFYCKYKTKHARPLGETLEFREANRMRREFTFFAAVNSCSHSNRCKALITQVIKDIYPIRLLE